MPTQRDSVIVRDVLSDPTGLPAKRFAEFDPLPSLDWLTPMTADRFGHVDLERFGVRSDVEVDKKLAFSLLVRPTSYKLASRMTPVLGGHGLGRWDQVMAWLAHWLARHLNDGELLLWVAGQGGTLHPQFAWHVDRQLNAGAVRSPMDKLWRLVLADRLHDMAQSRDTYSWREQLIKDGFSPLLRLRLCDLLRPRVSFSRPIRLGEEDMRPNAGARVTVRDLVEWEVKLTSGDAVDALGDMANNTAWRHALPNLLWDATDLLRDALDLMRVLDGADDRSDQSYIAHPSISDHSQNRYFQEWTFLIELVRDAWLAVAETSPKLARAEIERWLTIPYPLFRRLAFFAAARD